MTDSKLKRFTSSDRMIGREKVVYNKKPLVVPVSRDTYRVRARERIKEEERRMEMKQMDKVFTKPQGAIYKISFISFSLRYTI